MKKYSDIVSVAAISIICLAGGCGRPLVSNLKEYEVLTPDVRYKILSENDNGFELAVHIQNHDFYTEERHLIATAKNQFRKIAKSVCTKNSKEIGEIDNNAFIDSADLGSKTACSIILLLGCLLVFTGCSQRLGDFTVLSTKNVDLSHFSTQDTKGMDRVRGEDVGHFIILSWNKIPNPKEAVDVALDSNNAYMLSDAVLRHDFFYALFYAQMKFVAEGVPVKRN